MKEKTDVSEPYKEYGYLATIRLISAETQTVVVTSTISGLQAAAQSIWKSLNYDSGKGFVLLGNRIFNKRDISSITFTEMKP
jgi:hypothetical protein